MSLREFHRRVSQELSVQDFELLITLESQVLLPAKDFKKLDDGISACFGLHSSMG